MCSVCMRECDGELGDDGVCVWGGVHKRDRGDKEDNNNNNINASIYNRFTE